MRGALVSAALLLFVLSVPSFAQTSNATLGGTVADNSGALVPGVTVTATNTETGIVNMSLTNETGAYQFASLQPGLYKVTAELPGFQTKVANDLRLALSQQARLNFTLEVGSISTQVEVSVASEALLTSSSSVGTVLPEYKVQELPLANRDVLDLVATSAGVVGDNFAGGRINQVMTTVNGIGVNDGRYSTGVYSATQLSPDLVSEVRILVSPADAETGRGSGQVQVSTRSGTNDFRGSLFYTNHNSALDAATWFQNFNGTPKTYLNRNQFGGRLGGPVARNKTFFFFLYDGQRVVTKSNVTATVLTPEARQGNFRYFPGTQNANIIQANPTVDVLGNPVRPATATGPLQTVSLYGKDPFRIALDPTGNVQKQLAEMPLPNIYSSGDGLNTAGYRFTRRDIGMEAAFTGAVDVARDQLNFRLDHNFNPGNKAFVTFSREHVWSSSQQASWPSQSTLTVGGLEGTTIRYPKVFTSSWVSTLSPNLLNEFRAGLRYGSHQGYAAYDRPDGGYGKKAFDLLPKVDGQMYLPSPGTTAWVPVTFTVGSRISNAPLFTWADTLSWTRSKHAFKGGVEIRFGSNTSQQNNGGVPIVRGGAGGVAVQGIDPNSTNFPGLNANDATLARTILSGLAGSVNQITQSFYVNDSASTKFSSWQEMSPECHCAKVAPGKIRNIHQREMSTFFKDDWKLTQALTVNLGVRYEYYAVPWEENGMFGTPVGNGDGLFGISGTSFADMFQPGKLAGKVMVVEQVGKHSPNPDKQIYKDDYNNFAPAVGLSWSVPWFGKDKTVLRIGYGISYQGGGNAIKYDYSVNAAPGIADDEIFTSANYLSLANIHLPIPRGVPYLPLGFDTRTQGIEAFANNYHSPYVQNWNMEIQRTLPRNLSMAVRYVGSKGTALFAETPLNEVNIFENGILEAFKITRAGGDAPLFDKLLMGLNVTGAGVVNGSTLTGSQAFRQSTATRSFIANGDVGAFAKYLNDSTNFTNKAGGIPRNGGFPENWITVNPQANTANPGGTTTAGNATLMWNNSNSTYHSMQLELNKRLSSGFTSQTSYTWSKALGAADGDGGLTYRTLRNRSLNKDLLGFDRRHAIISSGTFSLPFGPNRAFLGSAPGIVSRLVENWQLAGIFNWTSGRPLALATGTNSTNGRSSFNSTSEGVMIVGAFPKNIGKVTVTDQPGVIQYFPGLQVVADPARAGVTTLQSTQASYSATAIADAQGNLLLINPASGELATLGKKWVTGPSFLGLDMNLTKRVTITETMNFELRADVLNILNTPQWDNPNVNINSTSFGRITAVRDNTNRTFTINARVNF